MNDKYILINGKPVPEPNTLKWARWFEDADRTVSSTVLGKVRVSTVFLGLDHSFGEGPPLLYETMIFGGPLDQYQQRYETLEQAVEGHNRIVKKAKEAAEYGETICLRKIVAWLKRLGKFLKIKDATK